LKLGIHKKMFGYLQRISRGVADHLLKEAGVVRTTYRGIGGIDFIGPHCDRILSKLDVITTCAEYNNLNTSSNVDDIRSAEALRLCKIMMSTFRVAHHCITQRSLDPDIMQKIEDFGIAHNRFIDLYRSMPGHKFQTARDFYLHSPQIHSLLTEVPRWIEQNGCTLARESEQACEAQHNHFLRHFANYNVPPTRAIETKSPSRSPSSSSSSSSASEPVTLAVSSSEHLAAARRKVMWAFIS